MLKIREDHFTLRAGPFRSPVNIEDVDVSRYRGAVGDLIRVRPQFGQEVLQVLVAIRTEKAERIECGLAAWHSGSGQFEYVAKAAFPPVQGARITITALAPQGHHTTTVDIETASERLTVTWRCGGEHTAQYLVRPGQESGAGNGGRPTASEQGKRPSGKHKPLSLPMLPYIATPLK